MNANNIFIQKLGIGGVSSLDLLSTCGMLNYFGRTFDPSEILKPILLRKGTTNLALYGLCHIPDHRLGKIFEEHQLIIEHPDETIDNWFNLMVVHQNRAGRGVKRYLPESILPGFIDLVMWGKEHECRIDLIRLPDKNIYVTQPGSSVATSFAEGEATDKHIGLLEIFQDKYNLTPIKLQTVRPFIFESVHLVDLQEELRLDEIGAGARVCE